ncbi:Uroporphyrinogen-III synthase [hydrothermal vent metagenome]|uniref:uroporphyrinogen-III synthase n=1 Tax=hydrothermal vent metagenome TaxID=652676 RepID=A0A3B0WQC2_9ZZZZ
MNPVNVLSKKTILITRPTGREEHLRQLIESANGTVIHYPVISIQPPPELDIKQLLLLREQLHSFTMAIFISPTAVEQSQIYFPALPEHFIVAAIGTKTAQALQKQDIDVDIEASEHDTKSLLKTAAFQMPEISGQRILIFRGAGGRALLGDTLIRRGAQVRYVEIYHRELPPHPPLTETQINQLNAITISSNEGLDNLITLMEDPSLLINIPLIVPSQRAQTLARQHGFKTIIAAKNATDEAIVEALTNHLARSNE